MVKGAWIRDIRAGDQFSGIFVASQAQLAKTKTNRPYWRLRLSDATGDVDAKIWQPLCDQIPTISDGAFVCISGNADLYHDSLQVRVVSLVEVRDADKGALHPEDFFKASSEDVNAMFATLHTAAQQEFTYEPWRRLILAILGDAHIAADFKRIPAACHMHHAWTGGLLEHTLGVFQLCRHIADCYPDLDRQTLLAGALLHDIGKIRELSSGPTPTYTASGELAGHIFLGLDVIGPFLAESGLDQPLKEHLQHLILSHHGMLEYGSPVLPKTAEAMALHYADNLDAKLAQCRQILESTLPNEVTNRQNSLKRALLKAQATPAPGDISPSEPVATDREIFQNGSEGSGVEPPWEIYDDYVPPEEEFEENFWYSPGHEEVKTPSKSCHASKKPPRVERCSLV